MLGFLQYLIAVFIVQSAETSASLRAEPHWLGIAGTLGGFALAARIAGWALARRGAAGRLAALLFAWNVGRGAALAAFYVVTVNLGGARIPAVLGIGGWVLVPQIVQILPFFALTAGLTWGLHSAARAAIDGSRTTGRAVLAEFHGALLPLAPVAVVVLVTDLLRLAAPIDTVGRFLSILQGLPATQILLALGVVFGALLVIPFVLRLVWRAKPLPDGPLRQRLEAYSRRTGFRARDILVWPTGDDVMNAAVVGALPRFRYVLITDGLLHTLDDDEIEAVFAHEAGHARRGHVLLFFGFTSVVSLIGVVPGIAGAIDAVLSPLPPILRFIVLLLVWLGVVLGWVSRRFEQEADVYGIETLPLPSGDAGTAQHPFARALERIGAEVGAIREVTGWRHFSIADRVEFVRRYVAEPDVRRSYRRSIAALRGTLLLVICGFGLAAAVRIPGEIARARAQWSAETPASLALRALDQAVLDPVLERRARSFASAGEAALVAGRTDEAVRWLREYVARSGDDPKVAMIYAILLQGTGRRLGARLVWEELAAREDLSPADRDAARRNATVLGSR